MEGMDIEEMRKEVEKVSEKVILEENEAKGRFLRAKMAFKTGEVVFSEPRLSYFAPVFGAKWLTWQCHSLGAAFTRRLH